MPRSNPGERFRIMHEGTLPSRHLSFALLALVLYADDIPQGPVNQIWMHSAASTLGDGGAGTGVDISCGGSSSVVDRAHGCGVSWW